MVTTERILLYQRTHPNSSISFTRVIWRKNSDPGGLCTIQVISGVRENGRTCDQSEESLMTTMTKALSEILSFDTMIQLTGYRLVRNSHANRKW